MFFFPGVGSLILGQIGQGIAQLLLYIFGVILTLTGILAIIGIPICVIVWIWAIVSAASANPKPMQVEVIHRDERRT